MTAIADLVEEISQRHEALDAQAAAAEDLGTAPVELVDLMRELRVPLAKVPTELGGNELAMADQLRYFEALSYSNPTAGWTGFNHAGAAGMAGAMLGADGVEAVFGSEAIPFFAAVSAPTGTFSFVDGGVRLSGHYRFASGAPHAEWVLLTGIEQADNPAARLCVLPAGDVSFGDQWDVMALQGTGSVDVVVDGALVPEHLLIDPFGGRQRGGPMYSVGYQAYVSGENLGFTLGVSQRFIDEIVTYAKTKSRGPGGAMLDRGAFQYELGKAQLQIDAARALGLTRLGEADEHCTSKGGLTAAEEQKVVAMLAFSTESAVNAVSHLFHFAGAGAIFSDNVLQRCFRDAHGSAQHLVASNTAYDQYGQKLLEAAG